MSPPRRPVLPQEDPSRVPSDADQREGGAVVVLALHPMFSKYWRLALICMWRRGASLPSPLRDALPPHPGTLPGGAAALAACLPAPHLRSLSAVLHGKATLRWSWLMECSGVASVGVGGRGLDEA